MDADHPANRVPIPRLFTLLGQWAIIVQNVICLCLSSFILAMKVLPQRKKEAVADALTPDLAGADQGDSR